MCNKRDDISVCDCIKSLCLIYVYRILKYILFYTSIRCFIILIFIVHLIAYAMKFIYMKYHILCYVKYCSYSNKLNASNSYTYTSLHKVIKSNTKQVYNVA